MKLHRYILPSAVFFTLVSYGGVQASLNGSEQEEQQETFLGQAILPQVPAISVSQDLDVETSPRFILSIDGGGIRGIIPAEILSYVEEKLEKTIHQRVSDRIQRQLGKPFKEELTFSVPLAQAFDIMSGTSIGGIIVLGLATPNPDRPVYPRYKVQTLLNLQKNFGQEVFSPTNKKSLFMSLFRNRFDTNGLEGLLNEYFGEVPLREALASVIVPAYELRQEQLYLFKKEAAQYSKRDDFLMKDAARATSAAPTYFSAASFKNQAGEEHLFADGGLIANNPAMAAFMQALSQFPRARSLNLLSIGTGRAPQYNLSKLQEKGLLDWGGAISSVIMDGTSEHTHELLQNHHTHSPSIPSLKYLRIQTTLDKSRAEMDNATEDNLHYLSALARRTIKTHEKELLGFVQDLADAYEAKGHFISSTLEAVLASSNSISCVNIQLAHQSLKTLEAWELGQFVQRKTPPFTLVTLNLENNFLTDDGITLLANALHFVKTLNIKNNQLSSASLTTLAKHAPLLTDLNLAQNPVASGVQALAAFKHLKRLDLSETGLEDKDLQTVVINAPHLVAFYGERNSRLREGGVLVKGLYDLKELYLARTSTATPVVEALKGSHMLTLLDLSHTRFNDTDAEELSTILKQEHHLQTLTLYYNEITDKGAQRLAEALRENTSLTELNLKNNGISSPGLRALGQSLHINTSLRNLNLSHNLYEEESLTEFYMDLLHNRGLQTVSVKHTNTGKASSALKQLRYKKPFLKIEETQARGFRG